MKLLNKLTPTTRRWIYRVAVALLSLLAGYGVIDGAQVELITGLVLAVLGLSLAERFVPDVYEAEAIEKAQEEKKEFDLE